MDPIGRRRWALAGGYLPAGGTDRGRALSSHETVCILNAGDSPAAVRITIFFTDREPAGPYCVEVAARRTLHLRFDDLRDPEPLPRGTDYASVIDPDVPVVVQHTRLDAREGPLALVSTIAFAAAE